MHNPVKPVELTLMFTAFIAAAYGFGMYLFASVLPDMRSTLGFSYATAGGMTALAQVGLLACASLSAAWVKRLGAERVVLLSVLLCCLSLGAMAAVQSTWQVALLLLCMGGAAAAVWVPMVAVVRHHIAQEHLGKVLGLMSSGTAYGVLLNGVVISNFMPTYGWRAVWVLLSVLTGALLVWGALRLAPAAVVREQVSSNVAPTPTSGRGLWQLVRQPLVAKLLCIMMLGGVACMPTQNMLAAYMRDELGYSAAQSGLAWSMIGLSGMVGGFTMGALADRISARRSLALTFVLLTVSAAAFLLHANLPLLYVGAALFGLSFNAIFGLVPTIISQSFGTGEATRVFAYATVFLGVGSMLGNALGGLLRDWTHSFRSIYELSFGLCLVLLALALALPKTEGIGQRIPLNP